MNRSQRGFATIELLVSAAIAFFLIWGLIAVANRCAAWAASENATLAGQSAAATLAERLGSEADSSWAVFVPTNDVLGASNGDGHEVDFFTEDGAHRPFAWAYRYDAASRLVTRYSYAPGIGAQAGESAGPFDSFAAVAVAAPSITADRLFAGASVPGVQYHFDTMPEAIGGNGLVHVAIRARGIVENEMLASATAPTSFTVVLNYTPAPPPATPTPGAIPTLTPTP